MDKVVIGIVAKHRDVSKLRTDTLIRDEIKDMVIYNGAIPIGIIPACKKIQTVSMDNEVEIYENLDNLLTPEEKTVLIAQINLCDGIVLGGGITSDAYEVWIANYCYNNDIPIIGICAGENNLVRAVGGRIKILNDKEIEKHSKHLDDYSHSIKIKKSSKLFQMIGKQNLEVNSRHRVSVSDPGCLTVVATDETGLVEAVEDKTKACYLGVRFHPESLYLKDEFQNNLFKSFVEICVNKKYDKTDENHLQF